MTPTSSSPLVHPPISRIDRAVALALLLAATLALQLGSRTQGFTRDEGYYFQAAENHVGYIEESLRGLRTGRPQAFADRRIIDRWLGYNSEHPPLMKTLFGISWRLLHRCNCPEEAGLHPIPYAHRHATLGLLSQGDAMRLPAHILGGALVAAVYLLGVLLGSRYAGLVGAALSLLSPRLFFHAQLSCFDAPVTDFIFFVTLAYVWASRSASRRATWWRAIVFSLVLAAALLTKHNTFFLPPVLLLHAVWARRALLRGSDASASTARRVATWILPPWAVCAATVTPLAYLAGWPHLWPAPVARFVSYVAFHLHHVHYNIEYLGVNYNRPPYPWHYVPVMTLLTVPVTTMALALLGIWALRRPWPVRTPDPNRAISSPDVSSPALLLLLSIAWPMAVIMRPGTPIFGAEKHWLPAIPFLSLVAGLGLDWVVRRAQPFVSDRAARLLPAVLAAAVCVPTAIDVARSHPYGLAHYNALAGGPAGGADLGMNRGFWGYAVRGLFPTLNRESPRGAAIYFHDANWPLLQMSMKDGLLRRDLRDSGMEEPGVRAADLALVMPERHFNKYEYWIWDAFGTTRPLSVATHHGVPVATLYSRATGAENPSSRACQIAR